MKTVARSIVFGFALLMIVGQLVTFGMKEGWGLLAGILVILAVVSVSFWYGFLHDDD